MPGLREFIHFGHALVGVPLSLWDSRSTGDSLAAQQRSRHNNINWGEYEMGELGGTVTYFYWSDRRTDKFLQDNNMQLPSTTRTMSTPTLRWLPTPSQL